MDASNLFIMAYFKIAKLITFCNVQRQGQLVGLDEKQISPIPDNWSPLPNYCIFPFWIDLNTIFAAHILYLVLLKVVWSSDSPPHISIQWPIWIILPNNHFSFSVIIIIIDISVVIIIIIIIIVINFVIMCLFYDVFSPSKDI